MKPTSEAFRFKIIHLFYLTALIAVGIVVAGVYSLLVSSAVMVFWWIWHRSQEKRIVLCVLLVIAILIGMLLPPMQVVRSSPRWLSCLNNMRQCMLAIWNYESAHGRFPPAWQVDDNGVPMHSWRVLILPFIEQGTLYNQYRFDEPWDGPNNSKLANQMPDSYRCPSVPHSTSETTYKLVSDPEAFFNGSESRTLGDAVDGTASTIVIVEDSEHPVNWMKPEGVSIEAAVATYRSQKVCHCGQKETLFSKTLPFKNLVTLDGATYHASADIDPETLRRAMKRADGFSPDMSEFGGYVVIHKPQGYVAVALYVFLLALPGWYFRDRKA